MTEQEMERLINRHGINYSLEGQQDLIVRLEQHNDLTREEQRVLRDARTVVDNFQLYDAVSKRLGHVTSRR